MRLVFDLGNTLRVEGETVIRTGLIFQCGLYPDKHFELTESEADAAIRAFTPAPININHGPSPLDGFLGFVRRIWRQGKDLFAEYAIPKALHDLVGGQPLKVSSEWDTVSDGQKRLTGCALVLHPRVKSAAMFYGFSQARDQAEGEKTALVHALQAAVFAAADLSYDERRKLLAGSLSAWQDSRDPDGYGCYCWLCEVYDTFLTYQDWDSDSLYRVDYTIQEDYTVAWGEPQAVIARTVYEPAPAASTDEADTSMSASPTVPTTTTPVTSGKEKKAMKWSEIKAFFTGQGIPVEDDDSAQDPSGARHQVTPFKVEETAEFKAALAAQVAAEAEVARLQTEATARFDAENDAAVDALVQAQKITPAQKDEHKAWRASDPVRFDAHFAQVPALKALPNRLLHPDGATVPGEKVAEALPLDPVLLERSKNDVHALLASGRYSM
jgi:hypothetical protein